MNRRDFLTKSGCALSAFAAPTILPARILGAEAPSQRINVGFIGTGRQGFGANLKQMLAVLDVQVVTVCDVDSWRMAQAQRYVNDFYATRDKRPSYNGCTAKADFRDVISVTSRGIAVTFLQ